MRDLKTKVIIKYLKNTANMLAGELLKLLCLFLFVSW